MILPPIINDVPLACIKQAAVIYHVSPMLIIAILEAEGGRVGMARPDPNGTYDYGPMQINTIWLDKIAIYGYTPELIQYDPCVNVAVGAWILSNHLAESANQSADFWRGAADYHSYTPNLNQSYKIRILENYEKLTQDEYQSD